MDEARPGALRSEASVIEIGCELGDLVRVRVDGGCRGVAVRGRPEAVGLVGIIAVVRLRGSDEIVGLLGAAEIEGRGVNPVLDVVT